MICFALAVIDLLPQVRYYGRRVWSDPWKAGRSRTSAFDLSHHPTRFLARWED